MIDRARGYLFDMDGTLVDSLADIGGSMNFVLRELGFPEHPIAAYRQMVGEGAGQLVANALPADRRELKDDALARYRAHYAIHLVAASRPYEGIVPLLEALTARGDRIGVVTNKPQAPASVIAEALFAKGTFGVVVGEREGVPRKPEPALALMAAESIGVEPKDCLFIGDTFIDIRTARAAGMRSVGVLWGFRDRKELEDAGADHIVASPEEIFAL